MTRLAALALLAAALAAASPAAAGYNKVFDLGAQVPVPGNRTWRDLLGQLFPDLRQEPRKDGNIGDVIHGRIDIRPVDKDSFEECSGSDPLRIEYIEYDDVQIDNEARLIVGITTDGCVGAVALFDGSVQGNAKLLDVVNIQQDQNYGFGEDFVRPLGLGAQLVVADSFHTTTSNSPDNYVLVLATVDKLSLIGNVHAESEWDCEHHRGIGEQPYVVVIPDYGRFDRITGYIKRTVQPVADDCRTHTGNPKITIRRFDWRWDAIKKAYREVSP